MTKEQVRKLLSAGCYLIFWDDDPDYEHLKMSKCLTGLALKELKEKQPNYVHMTVDYEKLKEIITPIPDLGICVSMCQRLDKHPGIGVYGFFLRRSGSNNEFQVCEVYVWGVDGLGEIINTVAQENGEQTKQEMGLELLKKFLDEVEQ